jgi:ring-1,2-phenylacetyl-CoA epoxidase subunit PaaD
MDAGPAMSARSVVPDESVVRAILGDIDDPEIPGLSLVDLGIVHDVRMAPGRIEVELLPTFTGCPALEIMRDAVAARLAPLAPDVEVRFTFTIPWTPDRITAAGRQRLQHHGVAPPRPARQLPLLETRPTPCPRCGSPRTTLVNAFGPTQCRAIHYCTICREPFEGFKSA